MDIWYFQYLEVGKPELPCRWPFWGLSIDVNLSVIPGVDGHATSRLGFATYLCAMASQDELGCDFLHAPEWRQEAENPQPCKGISPSKLFVWGEHKMK